MQLAPRLTGFGVERPEENGVEHLKPLDSILLTLVARSRHSPRALDSLIRALYDLPANYQKEQAHDAEADQHPSGSG